MVRKNLLSFFAGSLLIFLSQAAAAQVPQAGFSFSPNPVCSGTANVVQITDNSTGSPTSWTYVVTAGGPGPGGSNTLTAQNPTLTFNGQGIYTITLIAANASGASVPSTQTVQVFASPNAQINPANLSNCPGGNPLTMSVIAGGGPGGASNTYQWSTGATTSSISVSPSVTTTYSCIITSTNGCSTERTATVTISQPTISIASNPVNICPGTSSTLTATGTAPGPFTYVWSTSALTRTVSTNLSGVYTVTVTNSNGCTASQSYTLGTSTTLSLTASSTPSVLCAGNTATLHVTGAASYTWDTGVATPNASVNPTSATTYTVVGQIGTCTGTASVLLNVNVTPTLIVNASNSVICAGGSVTLNASGASTYTWLPSTISQSTMVSPSVSTTYTVRGNNAGCPNRTATVSISVSPNPAISISSSSSLTCAGEVVALASAGAATYTWSAGGNNAILIVTPTVTTTYTVTGSNQSNCHASASITQSVAACLGLNQQNQNSALLEVYPNPNQGVVNIKSNSDVSLSLFNQQGQFIKSISLNTSNGRIIVLTELVKGMYYISGIIGNEPVKQKIIVSE